MIIQYKFTLPQIPSHPLYPDAAYRLYAHLLEKLPPEDAFLLHEAGGREISQFLQYDKSGNRYIWTISLLSEETAEILCPVLETLTEVFIENQAFPVSQKTIREITAEDLILRGRAGEGNRTTILFHTQTAFRQNGRYTIFPQERLILQSLILRWNEVFPMYPLEDEDAINAILAGIHIVDYQLRSGRFLLKGTRIPGFTGSCVVEAKLALPLLELWNAMMLFANFAGIGIKTGLGMGGVQTEPLVYPGK